MAITDACEHPEVIVAWADQFYSEEGGVLAWLGVEGETYKINEAGDWGMDRWRRIWGGYCNGSF